jgi:benzoyl-CoA 2,3-epoxidase subunit B
VLTDVEWIKNVDNWIPSKSDGDYITSLMVPQWERGKYANWIAAPKIGIDNKGGDFEYVKIHRG